MRGRGFRRSVWVEEVLMRRVVLLAAAVVALAAGVAVGASGSAGSVRVRGDRDLGAVGVFTHRETPVPTPEIPLVMAEDMVDAVWRSTIAVRSRRQ